MWVTDKKFYLAQQLHVCPVLAGDVVLLPKQNGCISEMIQFTFYHQFLKWIYWIRNTHLSSVFTVENSLLNLWFSCWVECALAPEAWRSLSGVHGLKHFLCSAHLPLSFDGRIYTYWSVLKSKFVHQRTHEDGHYRENPSNHELLTVRGGDCRASKKMFRGLLPPYWS